MRKKQKTAGKKIEEYYAQFPNWYWKHGLHDALILSVSELQLTPDYKQKFPKRNCMEIVLDSENALYEKNIKKICLYNYKARTPDVNINNIVKPWWISDTLSQQPNGYYLLEAEIESAQGTQYRFAVEFEFAEIERQ